MQISKHKQVLLIAWLLTLTVWLPPVWYYFFRTDYFLDGFRRLQKFSYSAPFLLIIFFCAVLLSLPKRQTRKNIVGVGCSFLTIGFLLQTYAMFHRTGGLIIMGAGLGLLSTLARGEGEPLSSTTAQISKTKPANQRDGFFFAWVAVAILGTPMLWYRVVGTDFFLTGMRSLQNPAFAGPFFLIMLCWAVLLSFPKRQTENTNNGAASSLLTMSIFLFWYAEFIQTAFFSLYICTMLWMSRTSQQKADNTQVNNAG
ncbi:hypothetical protein [Undibacterium umbellatum]|uniref:Uncharacterized protein n=1 Tax=Undibacterium umbellatum TaxID=2762300 RepID=A0ABR6Z873_9BURK|nr:hypothetical protein [Undibacterium umbellatum]MBC3907971.1 hypothetical protein [Undibacterium umbellatum]